MTDRVQTFLATLTVIMTIITGLVSCSLMFDIEGYNPKEFRDRDGNIYAGYPVTVVSQMWNAEGGKHPEGYRFYLVTKDCTRPEYYSDPIECRRIRHRASAKTFLRMNDGDMMVWNDHKDKTSKVEQHLWKHVDGYHETLYNLALLVKQCRPGYECVTDSVQVSFKTWYYNHPGETLTFAGDKEKVVS